MTDTHMDDRLIALPGAHNLRDMGGWPTPAGETAWRRLLRADSLHRLDAEGVAALQALGLALVIDLRREDETEHSPNPFAAGLPGVRYVHVSLFEGLDPERLATRIDAAGDPEVAADILLALYSLALEERGPAFVEVLRLIAAQEEGAVLFHCTAGKDRTGLIAALLLLLAGADAETAVRDYAVTAERMGPLGAALRGEAEARGVDFDAMAPFLGAAPETMRALLAELDARHGGAEAWLSDHGLSPAEIEALRRRLRPQSEDRA